MPRSDNSLGDTVLELIRTRSDLSRWSAANAHGRQLHEAVDRLRDAADTDDPAGLLAIVGKAISSAVRVILRADDSSGIIGNAIRDLLDLHIQLAPKAQPAAPKLITWMIKFRFDGTQDFFSIDVVDYAPVLGTKGLALYRAKLDEIASTSRHGLQRHARGPALLARVRPGWEPDARPEELSRVPTGRRRMESQVAKPFRRQCAAGSP